MIVAPFPSTDFEDARYDSTADDTVRRHTPCWKPPSPQCRKLRPGQTAADGEKINARSVMQGRSLAASRYRLHRFGPSLLAAEKHQYASDAAQHKGKESKEI
jgi:hypothetical protein